MNMRIMLLAVASYCLSISLFGTGYLRNIKNASRETRVIDASGIEIKGREGVLNTPIPQGPTQYVEIKFPPTFFGIAGVPPIPPGAGAIGGYKIYEEDGVIKADKRQAIAPVYRISKLSEIQVKDKDVWFDVIVNGTDIGLEEVVDGVILGGKK